MSPARWPDRRIRAHRLERLARDLDHHAGLQLLHHPRAVPLHHVVHRRRVALHDDPEGRLARAQRLAQVARQTPSPGAARAAVDSGQQRQRRETGQPANEYESFSLRNHGILRGNEKAVTASRPVAGRWGHAAAAPVGDCCCSDATSTRCDPPAVRSVDETAALDVVVNSATRDAEKNGSLCDRHAPPKLRHEPVHSVV